MNNIYNLLVNIITKIQFFPICTFDPILAAQTMEFYSITTYSPIVIGINLS